MRTTNVRETGDAIEGDEDDGRGSACALQELFWSATFVNSFCPLGNL